MRQKQIHLPLFWATQSDVKEKLKTTQEVDKLKVIQHLASREGAPSASYKLIVDWRLGRRQVRKMLQHLARDRKLQAAPTNSVGATRFKAVQEGKLRHTESPNCQSGDSWAH